MTFSTRMTDCPYCGKRMMKGSVPGHIARQHEGKPMPSDKGFPGWKD